MIHTLKLKIFNQGTWFALFLVMGTLAIPSYAELYKWVDEKGKVHFSDQKPPDQKNTETIQVEPLNTMQEVEPPPPSQVRTTPKPKKKKMNCNSEVPRFLKIQKGEATLTKNGKAIPQHKKKTELRKYTQQVKQHCQKELKKKVCQEAVEEYKKTSWKNQKRGDTRYVYYDNEGKMMTRKQQEAIGEQMKKKLSQLGCM